jgi:hypothetical protein
MSTKSLLLIFLCLVSPAICFGQERLVIVRHGTTPEGDIIRARADAILLLRQAELVGEKAYAQRLENLIRECDVVYKRFATRNKMHKEALENKYERIFDIIRFNQQLADIRSEMEQQAVMKHNRIGDLTDEMNHLLEQFARQSLKAANVPAMKTELSSEQLDSIFLTDGSNIFSGKTGKTRLEAFKWPFMIQRKEFQQERKDFDIACDQAVKEINEDGSPSPEVISDLLKQLDAIDQKLDGLSLSDSANVRAVETKWRKEAKSFIRELIRTLANCSRLDSDKLAKYVFKGNTLGELLDHLNSKGLRFSHPSEQDANLYASIFFIMRYAAQRGGNLQSGKDEPNVSKTQSEPHAVRHGGESHEIVDLLALAGIKSSPKSGLVVEGKGSPAVGKYEFSSELPKEYDLNMSLIRTNEASNGTNDTILQLPVDGKCYSFCIRNTKSDSTVLFFGKSGLLKMKTIAPCLPIGQRLNFVLNVRKNGIKVSLDGHLLGEMNRLAELKSGDSGSLAIIVFNNRTVFTAVRITEVSQ